MGDAPAPFNTTRPLTPAHPNTQTNPPIIHHPSTGDKPEEGPLQTKLLEINLITNPQVADAILAQGALTHYDRPRVAQLCEKAGLYMRALQHYTDLKDIKRAVVNTHAIDAQALVEFFGTLSAEWAMECLKELLASNQQANLQLVVNIAKEYTDQLGADKVGRVWCVCV